VRVRSADQVHRDIGIDEDQPWYPRSISLSICSMSAVGNEYFATRRTAFNLVSGSITARLARASRRVRRTHSPTVKRSRLAKRWMPTFGIGKQHLKTLAHRVSIEWSLAEYPTW
jgi:hypothetical protein